MDFNGLKVGLLFPGEFRRLGPHVGAWEALCDLRRAGLFPVPTRAVGGSAGAIISMAMCPMTEENNRHVHRIVRGLRPSHIFSIPLEKKISGSLAIAALSFPLLNHLEPQMRAPLRITLHVVQTLFGIGLGAWIVQRIFAAPSDFSNEPLRALLEETFNFSAIRRAKTEVRIMATDIETGEHVAYSTWEAGLTRHAMVSYPIASATLPGTFPLARIGSRWETDAEVRTNFPIEQLEDMDIVFEFCYSEGLGQHGIPRTKREHEAAMWDIAKSRISAYAHGEYERRRRENPRLPEVVRITSDRRVQPLTLESFTEAALERAMCLGYDIVTENADRMMRALGRAMARKETEEK